jgi:hypothetical protein
MANHEQSDGLRCPDCTDELIPIKVFGRGGVNPLSGAALDSDVYYTDERAMRSAFLKMYDPQERGYALPRNKSASHCW